MTQDQPDAKKPGFIRGLWNWLWTPSSKYSLGGLLIVGGVAGIVFWGGFHWSMEISNTEEFCISCHEMQNNVYVEYQDSVHAANASGVRATCPDCHVPKEWQHKIVRKIQASNELLHWAMGSINTREKFEDHRMAMQPVCGTA